MVVHSIMLNVMGVYSRFLPLYTRVRELIALKADMGLAALTRKRTP